MKQIYDNVYEFTHPLVQHKLTMLRMKETGTNEFRKIVEELGMLMGYEALADLKTEDIEIETPIEKCKAPVLAGRKLAVAISCLNSARLSPHPILALLQRRPSLM